MQRVLVDEKTDMKHNHESEQAALFQCDCCFLITDEYAPKIAFLVGIDTMYTQMATILVKNKGNRDPFASRSLAAFARHVGQPIVRARIRRKNHGTFFFFLHVALSGRDAAAPLSHWARA